MIGERESASCPDSPKNTQLRVTADQSGRQTQCDVQALIRMPSLALAFVPYTRGRLTRIANVRDAIEPSHAGQHARRVRLLEATGNLPGTQFMAGHKHTTATARDVKPSLRAAEAMLGQIAKPARRARGK